ncbi:MAG TPA: AMP-binding protein [Mycobacteriales bacterium]|jgi:long-chain acyl-CoA synthetase|nr:AMP-binding protein [Mycobacteriales bacterium]
MPSETHLGALVESAFERRGDETTLVYEGRRLSAAERLDAVRRLTGGLVGLGIRPGERVVVCMANGPEVEVAYGAIWRAGAVVTPVVFLLSEAELRHVLADSGAVAVITSPELLVRVAPAAAAAPAVRHVIVAGDAPGTVPYAELVAADPHPLVDRKADDLGALMYTGGTTGRAKGVMLTHGNLWWCGRCAYERGRDTYDGKSSLTALPLSHAFGLIVTIVGAFIEEQPGPSVLMRWFEPAGWLRLAAEHRVSGGQLVPSMLALLLQQPLEDHDLSELRYLSVGAAPLPAAVRAEWEKRVPGAEVLEGYGCTESGAVISSSTLADRRAGSVGRPLPRYEVRVVDDAGRDVAAGADGEVWARGPGVMTGYWNDPETTAGTLAEGWLHTGDVGHLDADGFLWLVDRKKDLIIRSGVNVFPRDVEEVLLEHPGIAAAAVVGRPDPVRGEEVVAFVAARPGSILDAAEVEAFAAARLSGIHRPHDVRVVDTIPVTSVGKTDRKALRSRLLQ